MKDEVWKIEKGALMCFLSRSFDAACLWRARVSMTKRFPPKSLQSVVPQSYGTESHCQPRRLDRETERKAFKQLFGCRLSLN